MQAIEYSEPTSAHISLPPGVPGIIGPMMAYPETAAPLNALAELLLVSETPTFSKAERETVASYVSYLNRCVFCSESHAAVADYHWNQVGFSKNVWKDQAIAPISDRLKAQLEIARKVQEDARSVAKADIDKALKLGATERDIHDTVLIAAAFCMYNRYVDGLGTMRPPKDHKSYQEMGARLAQTGYINALK